ncbi:hypothetical protein HPB50_028436 [Hyalomma asiaticum]|nr:hypothetical protein HPB50_028436 [Hyalomma asiaticum]
MKQRCQKCPHLPEGNREEMRMRIYIYVRASEREWGAGRRESERREKERRSTAPNLSYTLSTHARAPPSSRVCERPHTPERAPPLHSLSATPPALPAPVARGEDKRARPQLPVFGVSVRLLTAKSMYMTHVNLLLRA